MKRRAIEIALVVAVSLVVLLPGIHSYSLVDAWETHYGEVSREMRASHDWVHTDWQGNPDGEGFRSKPILQFWAMAASMTALGVGHDGGYSGEMVQDGRTMVAIRLPFVLFATMGLVLMWWMLARLVDRKLAWLALLVVASCPFYCLVARQAIPDMPLCALVIGALAMFLMALEDGDRPASRLARWTLVGVVGTFIVVQAITYTAYFLPTTKRAWVFPIWMLPSLVALVWPIRSMRQVYLLWCYALLGTTVLAKGPVGLGVVGLVGVAHVVLLGRWREVFSGFYELWRGIVLIVVIALPWHVAMYFREGQQFIDEYLFFHILNRGAVGVDNSPGTFEMYTSQLGHGMWLWAALLPAAFVATVLRADRTTREGRVRFHVALWAIAGAFFFSIVQTKFHHYILPIVPALGILVAFLLRDIWLGRDRLSLAFSLLGIAIVLLVCRDLVFEPKRWIEMFIYRYDRPWPSAEPYAIDPTDGFLALGIAAAGAIALLASPWRRAGVVAVVGVGLAIGLWSLHAYMPIAARHWGMREAIRAYYQQRTVYGEKVVYFGGGELWDDWHDNPGTWAFDTFVPDALQVGQPMTVTVQVRKVEDNRVVETEVAMAAEVTDVGDHRVTLEIPTQERAKLSPLLAGGESKPRGRPPIHAVDADRLLAYQLYWRGEVFWSGDEILAYLPEMRTVFMKPDNLELLKYLNDRSRAPLGRRYFLETEAGRALGVKSFLPTPRARETFEVVDTTSNKFTMVSFVL